MKLDKGAILASMAIIVVASVFAGAGTTAYFRDTETVGPKIVAGTVDLQLSKDYGEHWAQSLGFPFPTGFAPGDDFVIEVWLRNKGTSGMKILSVGGSYVSGSASLARVIEITTLDATEFNSWEYMGVPIGYWQDVFDGGEPLTLWDFVASPYSAKFWEGNYDRDAEGYIHPTTDYLDAGGLDIKRVKLEFHFMDEAGNDYQGLDFTFDIVITITDDTFVLDSQPS